MRAALLLATLFAATPALAADLPPDLAEAAEAFAAAQVANDGAALGRLVADDYLLVNNYGQVETKADLIRDHGMPGFRLDPFTVERPVAQVWASGAVLGGIATFTGAEKGMRYEARLRFSDVWAKRDGRWQVIYTQASLAPKE